MTQSETIGKIAAALLLAQTEMGSAIKGSTNPYFKSSYADLNSIRSAVIPALNKNGISVLQPTGMQNERYYVQTILLHESGEYIGAETEIIASKANDPQAAGSAISYARRYGLQALLNVGAVDDDGEAAMSREVSKPEIFKLKSRNSTPATAADIAAAIVARKIQTKDEILAALARVHKQPVESPSITDNLELLSEVQLKGFTRYLKETLNG